MKVVTILGTRPEIIKLAPIIKKIGSKNCSVIFTGQHYDRKMGLGFMRDLDLPKPDYSLNITKSNPQLQISEIIGKLSKILIKDDFDSVIVQGDTNTVLAAGICSLKSNIPISHVESGLRSNDWRMPEEHNRIAIDHLSEFLFAPTKNTKFNLISEKVHGQIFVTGNTVIDAINIYSKISKKKSKLLIPSTEFILSTLHRAENVDDRKTLSRILKGLINSNEKIIFPIHPRTKKRLHEFGFFNKLDQNQNIQTALAVNISSPTLSGVGNEPEVIGSSFGLAVGQTSKAILGNSGVFYVYLEKLNRAQDLPNYLTFANNLSSSKTNNLNTKVYEALKDASKIDDKRSLFY